MSEEKKAKKRNKVKHPNLIPKYNTRHRQERIDFDYLDKLNEEELAWLDKFMAEENSGSFKNDGTDFNKTQEERREIYNRNNRSNRCLYGQVKAKVWTTKIVDYHDHIDMVDEQWSNRSNPETLENAYIDFLEKEQVNDFIEEYSNMLLSLRDDE